MKTADNRQKKNPAVRFALMTALMLFSIITYTGCGYESPVSKSDFCLNTICEITIYNDMSRDEAEQILDDAFGVIRDCEAKLSRTLPDSEVTEINNAGGERIRVSEETAEVIETANTVSAESEGAFDITVGDITELWDFRSKTPRVPDDSEIAELLAHVDYRLVSTDGDRVRISDPQTSIDLGGVAKGYITDRVCDFLEAGGVTRAVVNLGGNVGVLGEKEENTPWTVGIEQPFADRTELIGKVEVTDAVVVTSGIYERNFEVDGKIYHHILDPDTGYPAETDLDAVTVTAKRGNSGFCDAVSTACLVMGKDKAVEFIERMQKKYPDMGLEAAFIDNNGDIVQTDGMKITFSK